MTAEDNQKSMTIAERMRREWDRRIAHDYRYWMSDGVESDAEMWAVGERDFELLFKEIDLSNSQTLTVLELGCGVGRLLRAAASRFGRVIGIDVSKKALEIAREKLAGITNIELIEGNGLDLSDIPSGSVDVAYSFAALCSMPIKVIAAYLLELSRVCKEGAVIVLQVYLGRTQDLCEEDTIGLRSFVEQDLRDALNKAGFEWLVCQRLVLPFEVSDEEKGVIANLLTIRRIAPAALGTAQMTSILGGESETSAGNSWDGSVTEYYMALSRVYQHLEAGNGQGALEALEFAESVSGYRDSRHKDLRQETMRLIASTRDLPPGESHVSDETTVGHMGELLTAKGSVQQSESHQNTLPGQPITQLVNSRIAEKNFLLLSQRFPAVYERLCSYPGFGKVTGERTALGEVVFYYDGIALTHLERPLKSAQSWVERTLSEERVKRAGSLVLAGCGGGYSVECLVSLAEKPVALFEPRLDILKSWLSVHDASTVLERVVSIATEVGELKQGMGLPPLLEIVIQPQARAVSGQEFTELARGLSADRGLRELTPHIGLVGPIYGGTLPMVDYVSRALRNLGQRLTVFNFGGFVKPYFDVQNIVQNEKRVDTLQNKYVEFLSDIVLEAVSDKPVDILICLAQAPLSPRVLTQLRSRGIITVMWFVEDCGRFQTWKTIAPYFDYIFIIQNNHYLEDVRKAGAGKVYYLPTACDPEVHRPMAVAAEEQKRWGSTISFVGAGYNNRRKVLSRLATRDFKIWGTEWPMSRPFDMLVQENGRRISPEEYVKIFNASAINLNLHSSSERDGVDPSGDFVNPRTFELAACGAFQLVDERRELPALFEPDKEVICFRDPGQLEQLIDYYSAHSEERGLIAERSRVRALRDHTYVRRMMSMLGFIYADRYEELRSRAERSPWVKIIAAARDYPELQTRLDRLSRSGSEPTVEALAEGIKLGSGELSEEESKIMFLYHVKKFISSVKGLNEGKTN